MEVKQFWTVDRLIVGGKEVIPGSGTGGTGSGTPPELTTEKERKTLGQFGSS